MPATRRLSAGFTLVEVLVALVVMAIMAVMAWQGVDGIVRARDASQVRLEQTLRLNTVIAQWEQDLASLQESSSVPQALNCDGATVRLTRRAPVGLQIVAWSLRPDLADPALATWQRWASPAVTTSAELTESWLRSLQLQGTEPGQVTTLTGLTQWQVYFFQGNAWSNCQSSGNLVPVVAAAAAVPGDAASAAETGASGASGVVALRQALPGGVRLVLSFAPASGLAGELTRDTLIDP